jgi:uncharacterized membrane protein YfcA
MAAPVSGHISPEQLSIVTDMLANGQWKYWGVALLGFMGGTLSGFIGSGGAFLMTPGMMNLGVPGVMAVGANITHKFGKAMMGSKKHGEYGHVDKKLAIFLLITALVGIKIAVWVNGYVFHVLGQAGSSLYVSAFFVLTLTLIGGSMLKDALRTMKDSAVGPSKVLVTLSSKLKFKPMIHFPVSGVDISLWTIVVIGIGIGYMAGTIGVGGFVGVPAMIYIFGVPTVVAAGSELFLAMFMGRFQLCSWRFCGSSPDTAFVCRIFGRHLRRRHRNGTGQGTLHPACDCHFDPPVLRFPYAGGAVLPERSGTDAAFGHVGKMAGDRE